MFARSNLTKESEILRRCQKGDRKAQRELYDTYSGRFLSLCLRYIKERTLAEDVMIEGFMKIFDKLVQFEGKGSFEGWMRKIMVTQSLLHLRNNRNLRFEVHLEGQEDVFVWDNTEGNLESEELLRFITELPLGYRTVFNLYAIEGYSHKEIQELLGISESTSKSQLSRARAILRNRLKEEQIKEKSHGR